MPKKEEENEMLVALRNVYLDAQDKGRKLFASNEPETAEGKIGRGLVKGVDQEKYKGFKKGFGF